MRSVQPIRVVVADDHEQVRKGLVSILETDPSIQVVAEAADGIEAVERTERHRPDIVVLDLGMPRMGGLEAARAIRARTPGVQVLVLTVYDDDEYVLDMVAAGAAGYLLKESAASELLPGVHALRDGRPYFGQHALRTLVSHLDG